MLINDAVQGLVRGRIAVGKFDEQKGLWLPTHYQQNQIQYSWGFIAARQLGFKKQVGRYDYTISGMYIEFENVADPEDPVTIPTYERSEGRDYYDGLMASGTRDYLRVPLRMEPALSIAEGYEDYFEEGEGNMLTFFALSSGATGVHGKTFSSGANSKICGFALVAMPVFADATLDVIAARTYLAEENQQVKDASAQAGVTWELIFG
jgi:hypothetical protein